MSMNTVPASERIHIGIFGKRNAGKSSVINAVTMQELAVVSPMKGTTTDPVSKTMELLPLGPVVVTDTPGLDDEGDLGALRVKKALDILNKTDIAVLVVDATVGMTEKDFLIADKIKEKNIPCIIVMNKSDLVEVKEVQKNTKGFQIDNAHNTIWVSSTTGENINELKELIGKQQREGTDRCPLIADLLNPLDVVVLVVPIDSAAPKGRLIMPQQQTIRDILEAGAMSVVVKESEFKQALKSLIQKPKLVITDSQVFGRVAAETPEDVMLTSFSILFARYKGDLKVLAEGAETVKLLKDGDKVLIAEGCTHHRQCEDIGTVKLPRWMEEFTQRKLQFTFSQGTEFSEDISKYNLIVHCGGCMQNNKEMGHRIQRAIEEGTPITNYGVLIAYMKGILSRSLKIFNQ